MVTVLLVDDDCMILSLCTHILTNAGGVGILPACDGTEALRVAGDHSGAIHLLLSDIVMPGGITGVQLAETLTRLRPGAEGFVNVGLESGGFPLPTRMAVPRQTVPSSGACL